MMPFDAYKQYLSLKNHFTKDKYDYHGNIFDYSSLESALKSAGFKTVRTWNWRETEHSHIDDYSQAYLPHMDKNSGKLVSLNVEGLK